MAVKITSVLTRTVETDTLVRRRDSNHARKWMARQIPLAAHRSTSRPVTRFSSARYRRSTTGSRSSTVHPSRYTASTPDGARENRTRMAEAEIPSTPTIKISLLRLVPTHLSSFPFSNSIAEAAGRYKCGTKNRGPAVPALDDCLQGLSYLEALTARMASMSMGVTL